MKIGVIGVGIVGSATANAFRAHVDEVRCWDVIGAKCSHSLHDTICGTDLTFVCLPTPQKVNSLECDTSCIDEFFNSMAKLKPDANYVLRSTVPVGYTRKAREVFGLTNLVHSPEFLTARTADFDAANPTRMLIGHPLNNEPHDCRCETLLGDLYQRAFHQVIDSPIVPDWDVEIFHMTSDESEFVKLMQNAFSAIKIAAFNEFRCFSDAKGLDWERCLAALLAGGWINPQHTNIPGPDGKFGYGGACLPKDIANLVACVSDANLTAYMCSAAMFRNKGDRCHE